MGCKGAKEASEGGGERHPSCCCTSLPEPPVAALTSVRLQLCEIAVAAATAAAASLLPSSPISISRSRGDSHRVTIHDCGAIHDPSSCGVCRVGPRTKTINGNAYPHFSLQVRWMPPEQVPLTHTSLTFPLQMGSAGSKPGAPSPSQPSDAPVIGTAPAPTVGKSGKKICCSCPETKAVRFWSPFSRLDKLDSSSQMHAT